MITLLVWIVTLVTAIVLARRLPGDRLGSWDATPALAGRAAPWVIGVITSVLCAYVWGHLQPTAVVHDEASYVLQARMFARGAFAMPAPPLPEFFEQFHTYVTPAFASKYPPGHALLLAIGAAVGWIALVPLLLDGLTGALVFLVARRVTNAWVALLTWTIWITSRAVFFSIASYFSQSTSCALWMLGWWALLEWRDTDRRRWLLAFAACVGWLAITRPLTALAYALPSGIVVLTLVVRRRRFVDLAMAAAVGLAILLLIPYANQRTTGDWRVMPYSEYSKIYFPFDAPGFGLDTTPPRRALPPDMVQFGAAFRPLHVGYEPSALGGALVRRMWNASLDLWRGPRILLALVALAAIPLAGAEVGVAIATLLSLFVCYLSFAHSPFWTIYYAETLPILALLSALGLWKLLSGQALPNRASIARVSRGPALATLALVSLYLAFSVRSWGGWRRERIARQQYQREFFRAVASIPDPKAIVFIRYAPRHNLHVSLIANDPDLQASHAWLVYDRGQDNQRLQRAAPDRVPYLYDETQGVISRYPGTLAAAP